VLSRNAHTLFNLPGAPANNIGLDAFVGLKAPPCILGATAWKRNNIGSIMIAAQQLDG
jgi:hypothetical protein